MTDGMVNHKASFLHSSGGNGHFLLGEPYLGGADGVWVGGWGTKVIKKGVFTFTDYLNKRNAGTQDKWR